MSKSKVALVALIGLSIAGCSREGEITSTGIITHYSAGPSVAIVAPTGDITLFNPPTSRDAAAIDVVATMTNVRSNCNEAGETIQAGATFDIQARRSDNRGAREVVVPYYASVVQGGTSVVSKSVTNVVLRFAERRPGDADAAIDPMSDPAVRAAVQRASFEVLLGFNLTPEQLRYNATR
jgi:hypothetical protein